MGWDKVCVCRTLAALCWACFLRCDKKTYFCVVPLSLERKVYGFGKWAGMTRLGRIMGEGCSSFVRWRLGANSLSPLPLHP